jgi:predicted dienelactone hydrolase
MTASRGALPWVCASRCRLLRTDAFPAARRRGLLNAGRRTLACLWVACAASSALGAECDRRQSAGYRVLHADGDRAIAVWYPTAQPERLTDYAPGSFRGRIAKDAPASACPGTPLVLFSHGLGGCGIQSLYITEELARQGYVVAAPDHRDASLCSIEPGNATARRTAVPQPSFLEPQRWTDRTHIERRHDLLAAIDAVTSDAMLRRVVDAARIGAIGHSLGGYAVLGMAGAWPAWKHPAVHAVVAMSPYVTPFLAHDTLRAMNVPVMYQGAVFDWGITPTLEGQSGAYARTSPPRYFVKLNGGTHFDWTNLSCADQPDVATCLKVRPNAYWISRYAIAFLDRHLKGRSSDLLESNGAGLASYNFVLR